MVESLDPASTHRTNTRKECNVVRNSIVFLAKACSLLAFVLDGENSKASIMSSHTYVGDSTKTGEMVKGKHGPVLCR